MNTQSEIRSWINSLKHARRWRDRFWHIGRILSLSYHAFAQWVGRTLTRHQRGQAHAGTLAFFFIFAVIGLLFIRNASHANSKHAEAPQLRAELRTRLERDTNDIEFWFSPRQGTVLALMKLGNNEYGGIVHRVTENNGQRWLGDYCYECTAFVGSHSYWYGALGRRGVIKRDGYAPLWGTPDVAHQYIQWLRIQVTQ